MTTPHRHLIMGTAGHIDHGKTALIQALTGIECDTHKEEKQRGITIHLGFAHIDLPGGDSVGIVDVPGHAAFVRTMVAGASGVDFCVLVVSADGGVMPQTREHLQIMEILGVRTGLVALTKTDLVDSDIVQMAAEEIRDLVKGTFLEGAPVVPVSSKTGDGIDDLRGAIGETASAVTARPEGEVFRLYVDRIFTVKGFGTVVTGSVLSGSLATGDTAYLLPGDRELRVRRLERHGQEADRVSTGDRASLNLVGLDRDQFRRGMMVSDRVLKATTRLDGRLTLFSHARGFGIWSNVIFYLGTCESQARVHLLDTNTVAGGETALVQIELPEPCIAQAGDRFVVRSTSSDITLGGGEIIDAFPLHHRRRPTELIQSLHELAEGQAAALVAAEVRKRRIAIEAGDIADLLNVAPADVETVIAEGLPDDIATLSRQERTYLFLRETAERWREETVKGIEGWHRRNPLEPRGRTIADIMGSLGLADDSASQDVLLGMLEELVAKGTLKAVGRTWALSTHAVSISPEMQRQIDFVDHYLADCGMKTPLMSELKPKAAENGIGEKDLSRLLRHLVGVGAAYRIDQDYLHASIVDRCRAKLQQALASNPEGLTVAEFRDLVGGNRKICLLMFAQFDNEGTTRRDGDRRVAVVADPRPATETQRHGGG